MRYAVGRVDDAFRCFACGAGREVLVAIAVDAESRSALFRCRVGEERVCREGYE